MTSVLIAEILIVVVLLAWFSLVWRHRDILTRLWREPILRHPVLIIESDDWGPGPQSHVRVLSAVCQVLERFRDAAGRHPVMTVGVVLGIPDAAALRQHGLDTYRRATLDDPRYQPMLEVLRRGEKAGVLSLHLHGQEHLWPPTFMKLARIPESAAREWLTSGDGSATEALPSHLQSRWVDASHLPSSDLDPAEIRAAVAEEVEAYARHFGARPDVVVPPTFVWTAEVERAWAAQGLTLLVTPGARYTARDGAGRPAARDRHILNGEAGEGGLTYLVRDIYFEPSLGHRAGAALLDIRAHHRLGRPALLETHRFNFVGDETGLAAASLAELEVLLETVLREFPEMRFVSTQELGKALAARDPNLVESGLTRRFHVWLRRLMALGRLRKLAWLTGLALPLPLALVYLCTASVFVRGGGKV